MIRVDNVISMIKTYLELSNKSEQEYRLPYGGSNPYYYCKHCYRSMIEVSYLGHFDNCFLKTVHADLENIKSSIIYEVNQFNQEDLDYLKEYKKEYEDDLYHLQDIIESLDNKKIQELFSVQL